MLLNRTDDYLHHLNQLHAVLANTPSWEEEKNNGVIYSGRVYVVEKGVLFLENSAAEHLSVMVKAPAIVGIASVYGEEETFHCFLDKNCCVYSIATSDASEAIKKSDCHNSAATVMAHNFSLNMLSRSAVAATKNAYSAIKQCIEMIDALEPEYKSTIRLTAHIQQRTNLSRSHVMKIISSLKVGGYIEVKRGRLIGITIPLPEKY